MNQPSEKPAWICATCGVQTAPAQSPPNHCDICEDERQYVGWKGQQWTTLRDIQNAHRNIVEEEEPRVHSIRTDPHFGIGQRAYLIRTSAGNLLWDCVSLLDAASVTRVKALGGVKAIAISHPHYYSSMREWSEAFGGAPVYLHSGDRQWVRRRNTNIVYWEGASLPLFGGVTLVNGAGHFDGYQVAHWPDGADGLGALFAGDQPQVAMDRRWVSFLYSYPNMIPLSAAQVRFIVQSLEPFVFDRLYGAFGRNVMTDAKGAVRRSADRYIRFLEGSANGL